MLGIKGFSKKDTFRWTKSNVPAPAEVIGSKFIIDYHCKA
jgi:hypothetical protein